jgi:ABC-2 type transport system permease protein
MKLRINLNVALASARFQWLSIRTNPDYFLALAMAPAFAIVFLSIVRHAGRADLTTFALLAPVLISLWSMSINVSGELISTDRGQGTIEPLIATPASYAVVLLGRVGAVSLLGLTSFVEVGLIGRFMFGVSLIISHPMVFISTLVAAVFAMSGTSMILASVFVLGRSTRVFQQSLGYPFYVLGGVIVPVANLPQWLQPLTKVVFLSWTSDLLRDACSPARVDSALWRLGVVVVLGAISMALGIYLIDRVLARVRGLGTMGFA